MKNLLGLLIFLSVSGSCLAQPGIEKWSITGELMLPSGQSNKAFKSYLNGLLVAQPKLTYSFSKHWYASVGPRYMYYTVSEFKVPQKMNGGLHVAGGNVELGYKAWQTPKFGIEFGVKVGAAAYMFRTDSTRTQGNRQVTAMNYEPNIQFVLLSDEAVAYRWIVGYNFAGFAFQPDMIRATGGGYKPDDLKASAQSIVVGFGITYYLGNKRSDTDLMDFSE